MLARPGAQHIRGEIFCPSAVPVIFFFQPPSSIGLKEKNNPGCKSQSRISSANNAKGILAINLLGYTAYSVLLPSLHKELEKGAMRREKKHLSFDSLVNTMRRHCELLPEPRHKGKLRYPLVDIVLSAFACMFFQDRSLLQFQRRMEDKKQRSNVNSLFKVKLVPEDTQL
jgi:hypothetical protein